MAIQRPRHPETDSFAGLLLRHRGRTGLTQRDVAARLGTSRRSVQDWESGISYPTGERLQALILILLEAGGLTVGREGAEGHALWASVLREAPRMHTPLDEVWLAGLLAERAAGHTAEVVGDVIAARPALRAAEVGVGERRQDWGEAPDVIGFVGRAEELVTLRKWVLEEQCRLAAVLGMGGIGKTALASRLAQTAAPSFERVYWRSLRDALPAGEWMAGAIGFLSTHHTVPPEGESERLAVLLQLLRDRPSLLVLDNFETVLEPGQQEGRYRDGVGGYGALLRAVGESRHQSCLVVTSREAPPELAVLGSGAVRRFQLGGLGVPEGKALLVDKQLTGTDEDWTDLIARFGGNGLALKVVGESIRQVFDGDIAAFLQQSGSRSIVGGIRRLLSEQIERSSALEQKLLRVLAVEREPVSLAELITELAPRVRQAKVLEGVEGLRRRSLVERAGTTGMAAFTLQSVVLEYVTDRLVEEVSDEIVHAQPLQVDEQPLIKAQAKDYVRQTQERLIGEPILQQVRVTHGDDRTEQMLLALLDTWRDRAHAQPGYGPGNVVNLLRLLRGDLCGLDLGGLTLRQTYLAGVEAQDASLAGVHLAESVLADAFNFPLCAALSGDGASLVAGTAAGGLWLWRLADRTPLLAVQAHTGPVYRVALSADGRLLASGSEDATVRLWEAQSGHLLATLEGHTGGVRGVALSADGRLVASGSSDKTVRLWEAPSGRLLATLEGHTRPVSGVALSADGRLLASSGLDGTVRVWSLADVRLGMADAAGGQPPATLEGHTGPVYGVALSADGRLLASGGEDATVRLWEAWGGHLLATLEGHTGGVRGVALSADGRLLASGGSDGTVRLWEAPAGRPLATAQGHTGPVWGVASSDDGRLLASGGLDGTVRLWEAPRGRLLSTLEGHTSGVYGVALTADGRTLASGGMDGTMLWEAPSRQPLAPLQDHTVPAWGVALSADGRLMASGGFDGTVRLWETRLGSGDRGREFAEPSADMGGSTATPSTGGRLLASLPGHTAPVYSVALSPDGRILVSGDFGGMVRLWSLADVQLGMTDSAGGRFLATLQGHTAPVYGVALSAEARLLASASEDGTVRLWEVPSGHLLGVVQVLGGGVRAVALSPDGRWLASGSFDGTVRLWDVPSRRLLATLQGHTGTIWGLALCADGRLLASGGMDGTVRLWTVPSGQPLATLEGHTGPVYGVALSADGRLLASGSFDGTVRLWEPSSGTCLGIVRSDRRYERVDITGLTGVTEAQRHALISLGAVDHPG